ncbi:hypothetical protein J2S74_002857 [Evansella vedderi]|uniref:DUF4258 domain-containing protein n=1 Tax=Evansella vedderi TaxID=38282 RepID=A0ABT9ZZF2_9BACI|nr:DUF4258 domain-containing protein [Evansella vedderi]MDQ0255475.1 hypothetical protein [Evansella vedderi]
MKDYWSDELQDMRSKVQSGEIKLGEHVDVRMAKRGIDILDVATAILTGSIVEGFDIGQYPKYRNPDPFRTICGQDLKGSYITVGVAIKSDGSYYVTTVYVGITERLKDIVGF